MCPFVIFTIGSGPEASRYNSGWLEFQLSPGRSTPTLSLTCILAVMENNNQEIVLCYSAFPYASNEVTTWKLDSSFLNSIDNFYFQ